MWNDLQTTKRHVLPWKGSVIMKNLKYAIGVYLFMLIGGLIIARDALPNTKVYLVIGLTIGCALGFWIGSIIDWQKLKDSLVGPKQP